VGVPFNIASYALLTEMLAHSLYMAPGTLIWIGGDCHIYENQIEGVREQITRDPKALPLLKINPGKRNLFEIDFDDITLMGYDPHPVIVYPVAK
jgi:thymidylate synthase